MKKVLLSLVFLAFFNGPLFAQEELRLTAKDSVAASYWLVGLGWNVVDDAGSRMDKVFNVDANWNYVLFPSRLSLGRYFDNGIGIELIGAYNQYQEGKVIDGQVLAEDIDYYSVDLRFSYDLNYLFGETGFFDPYIGIGLGYADANNVGRSNFLTTLGFRLWMTENLGFDLNTNGHISLKENASNHYQHALGLVYRLGSESKLSKKGEEKLLAIREMEEEAAKRRDSITAIKMAEQQRIAEKIRMEEQEAMRAQVEAKAYEEAEMKKWEELTMRVEAIGHVYFGFNSSYLTKKEKEKLDSLSRFLKEDSSRVVKVITHADSRGDFQYNQWLSEQRLEKVIKYLIDQNVDPNQLRKSALGEEILNNECKDNIPCPEVKHRENRRSEFRLIKL